MYFLYMLMIVKSTLNTFSLCLIFWFNPIFGSTDHHDKKRDKIPDCWWATVTKVQDDSLVGLAPSNLMLSLLQFLYLNWPIETNLIYCRLSFTRTISFNWCRTSIVHYLAFYVHGFGWKEQNILKPTIK